jgi:general secretion pathway protein K
LSTFLSADASAPADTSDHLMQEKDPLNAFLSGQMHDLQAKINLHNQIEPMGSDKADKERNAQMLARLFQQLNLPMAELALIQSQLPQTMNPPDALQAPMRVERLEQQSTAINMNTAPKEVIMASIDNMSAADAQHLMDVRTKQAFKTIEDIKKAMPPALAASVSATQLSTNTEYFETISTLRMGAYTMQERTWLNRRGTEVRMLWRQRMGAHQSFSSPPTLATN